MRCAPPHTLLSSSWPLVFIVALVAGAAFFGVGTALVRSTDKRSITWTRAVTGDDEPVGDDERREMLDRLRFVDADWAREAIALAEKEESQPR
jgi:hypothetical protein